ncbi:MAG TPA: OsmC family protein [Acidobacteriota bacterium]|nr:OsmC family protein [Acidobacteriota bacterium]
MSPASNAHEFACRLVWTGAVKGGTTSYETYSRECRVDFAGKPSLRGTSAPAFRGDPSLTNPEDLLVASLSMCHFLSYVALCARKGVNVIAYEDDASGTMERVERTFKFTDVLLRPRVTIAGGSDPELARTLHERAHHECFIASSVNFPVRHEPVVSVAAPV